MTLLASDGPNLLFPALLCAWIASTRSSVRPSWRKKIRWPRPHSGAVRNSSPLASPWRMSSARPGPMAWSARSENRFAVWLDRAPTVLLAEVRSDGVWQRWQPTSLNRWRPRSMENLDTLPNPLDAGAGGARNRWKLAKLSIELSVEVFSVTLLGTVAAWQSGFSSRSCW